MLLVKNKVESLQKKSTSILSVFTKTIQDLSAVNTEIQDEITDRELQVQKLEQEKSSLKQTLNENDKIIGKIEHFFNG